MDRMAGDKTKKKMNIRKYLRRRQIRKLAEKCLASQTLYSSDYLIEDSVENSMRTAKKFYELWEKEK